MGFLIQLPNCGKQHWPVSVTPKLYSQTKMGTGQQDIPGSQTDSVPGMLDLLIFIDKLV